MTRKIRREFTKGVKLEMFRRAGGPEKLRCEGCGMPLNGKLFEYDHTLECWERNDPTVALTAEDGKVLGKKCCHDPKSSAKAAQRAHGTRIIEKSAGIKRGRSSFATNRGGIFKKKMTGEVILREDR